jgi:tetratricopeptide (TPR) repeat protein
LITDPARTQLFPLKLMRAYLLFVASLAAAMASGGFSLTQAHAEGFGVARGQAGANSSTIPPPVPFSGFLDEDGLRAAPEKGPSGQNLGLEERKPVAPPIPSLAAQAPAATPKSWTATARDLKKALAPKPAPEAVRKQMLDTLFARLRSAGDPDDAQRIAATIERVWLRSESDTANLLMQRATVSMQARQYPLALSLLDKLVAVEPDWAEAWNQRATTRFLTGDMDGAMADIERAIKLEPRHFGALVGMGMILQRAGLEKSALEIFKKAIEIYPLAPDIQKLVEKLTLEVEGQGI